MWSIIRNCLFLTASFIIHFTPLMFYGQDGKSWEIKLGATGGIGVNSLVRTSPEIEGVLPNINNLPHKQIGESGLIGLYSEMTWHNRWGLSLGLERNFVQLKQNVVAGNSLYIATDFMDWDQFSVPILFSKYFSIGAFPSKLKVSIGPRLSYYDETRMTRFTYSSQQWLAISYARLRKVNAGIRAMVVWNSPISQRSNLNFGLGVNYDVWGPILNEVTFYQNNSGVYDLFGSRPEPEELVYRLTNTIRPLQYFFIIGWEISARK